MTRTVETVSVPDRELLFAPGILIPGAREPGMLASFTSSSVDVRLPDGPSTMDAATIAERQREGGGARNQRRSAHERSWRGLVRRLRHQLVMWPVLSGWRLRTNPA